MERLSGKTKTKRTFFTARCCRFKRFSRAKHQHRLAAKLSWQRFINTRAWRRRKKKASDSQIVVLESWVMGLGLSAVAASRMIPHPSSGEYSGFCSADFPSGFQKVPLDPEFWPTNRYKGCSILMARLVQPRI